MQVRKAAALLVVVLAAQLAAADATRGPEFGTGRIAAEIKNRDGSEDVDDYVAHLAAGETLTATVSATHKSHLRTSLTLLDPDGNAADARIVNRGGHSALGAFKVPASGTWTLRVAGDKSSEGAYTLTTRVGHAKAAKFGRQRLGRETPLTAFHVVEAVDGSTLSLRLTSKRASPPVTVRSITAPSGADVPLSAATLTTRGATTTLEGLVLTGGDGAYRVDVGIDEGEASYALTLTADPPSRALAPRELKEEPWIGVERVEGHAGELVVVDGAHFAAVPKYPHAWIGGQPAQVVVVEPSGLRLGLVPPDAPGDTLADLTVQNADGQAITVVNGFHYLPSGPLDIASVTPSYVRVTPGTVLPFKVKLTRLAPAGGVDVTLALVGDGVGTVPATVHVPPNLAEATFQWIAAPTMGTGHIDATLVSTITTDVAIVPAPVLTDMQPGAVSLNYDTTQEFTLFLDSPATTHGLDVTLLVPGTIGTAPHAVHVDEGATSAKFDFTSARNVRATLQITALLEAHSAGSMVTVAPPTFVDLSGWTVLQRAETGAVATLTIPDGTVLNEGEWLFIGQNSSQAEFGSYWGIGQALSAPGSPYHYVDGGVSFPSVDGHHEKFELRNGDTIVDGPTVRMSALGVYSFVRWPGGPAWSTQSWSAGLVPNYGASPGMATPSTVHQGLYLSVISDSLDGHDWIEIFFDSYP